MTLPNKFVKKTGKFIIAGNHIGNKIDTPHRTVELIKSVKNIIVEFDNIFNEDINALNISTNANIITFEESIEFDNKIIDLLYNNEDVLFMVQHGLPGTADPGSKLIKKIHSLFIKVDIIPSPSIGPVAIAFSGMLENEKGYIVIELFNLKDDVVKKHLKNIAKLPYVAILLDHKDSISELIKKCIDIFKEDREICLLVNIGYKGENIITKKSSEILTIMKDFSAEDFFGQGSHATLVIPPQEA